MHKVALMGYGFLGKWHAEKVLANPHFILSAIVDKNSNNLSDASLKYKNDFPEIQFVSNIDEVLEQVDAIIIATPTSTHFDICQKLIKKQKNIFCEKPMTEDLEQAKELQELCFKLNYQKVFQVGHSERFHNVWSIIGAELKKYFVKNTVVTFNRLAPFKNRATDVDVVSDLMIHDIDLMLFLFNEKPESLLAVNGQQVTKTIDYSTAIFNFSNNRKVIINVSRIDQEEVRSLEMRSPLGFLSVDLMRKKFSRSGVLSSYEPADHLQLENNHFSNSIVNNKKAVVSLNDGYEAILMLDKVKKGKF